ncbi:MAG: hypothetical protein FJX74_06425, partial [Armatimonadetes bacterium]|nr:hypothetical protein [Armatimonadota bacterium]
MPAAPTSLGSWAARLRAVPAVHFRVAFAEEVHRLCADPATRPEAIAVELGPATAAAALDWLRELGVGSGQRVALPCMLGLTKANRFLHPSTRDLARELQETSGLELHELPPQLLHELLGYCAVSLLPLSPTDSIIEALRCALELEAPVYAVDLEDSAARERAATMLEDPSLASGRVDAYVQRMERPARAHRDPDVDDRREAVMASRLSAVLAAHERVLFTGGLAHWLAIRELLQDPGLAPAPAPPVEPATDDAFTRVIVHPSLAIRHMDLFPFVTELYEEQRRPANERSRRPLQLDVQHELGAMLQEAYGLFFRCTGPQDQLDRSQEDCETKPDFERFLTNLCTVKGLAVPDLFHTLAAAQGMMTDAFCRELAEVLMRFTWATPDDQLDLPILAPDSTGERSGTRATYVSRDGSRSRTFYIDDEALRGSSSVAVPAPREWEEHEPREKTAEEYSKDRRVWEPSEYLFTAFSLRAAQIAEGAADERTIEPFEGSLREGLDPKATLRGEIRGEKRPYVRD